MRQVGLLDLGGSVSAWGTDVLRRLGLVLSLSGLTFTTPCLAQDATVDGVNETAETAEQGRKSGATSKVTVESSGDPVTVAEVSQRMMASGYGYRGAVTVAGVAWKDICISPCSFEMEPGLHEIMVYGDGVNGATKKFQLREGETRLSVDPGSRGLALGGVWTMTLGIVALVTGGTFMLLDGMMDGGSS